MRMAALALAAAALLGAAGCASVATGTRLNDMGLTDGPAQPIAHVNGDCWGIYLFYTVPLLTGDTNRGDGGFAAMTVFSDTCRVEPVVEMVTRVAKTRGATKVTDLQSSRSGFPIIFPFIWYKEVQVSGNAVK